MSTPARHHNALVGEAAFFLMQLHEHIKPRKINPKADDLAKLYDVAATLAEDYWAEFVRKPTRHGLVLGVTPELRDVISAASPRQEPARPYPSLKPPMISPYAAPHPGAWEVQGKRFEWRLLVVLAQLIITAKVNAINAYSGDNGVTLAGVLALLRGREGNATAASTHLHFERPFDVHLAAIREAVLAQAELACLPVQVCNAVLNGGSHVSWKQTTPARTA